MSSSRRPVALVVAHQYLPSDPRIRRELDALADAGVSVDALCLRAPGEGFRDEYRGHRLYRLPVRRHRGAGLGVYLLEYAAFLVLAFAATTWLHLLRRYRTVVTHTLPDPLVFAALVPRLLGARVVIDMHEFTPELFRTRYAVAETHPLIRLSALLERASCAFATHVVTVHEPGVELLASRGVSRAKLVVIPNSDEMRAPPGVEGGSARERAADDASRPFTLVYHGLLLNQYDLATGLHALARLDRSERPVLLRIVGEGPDEPELRRLAAGLGLADRVRFEPLVSPADIPAILAECDAGLVPLRDVVYTHLMLPMKLLECAAHGLPIITTPSRTVRHYFPDDAVCYVPFGDADALAGAIRRMRDDAAYRRRLRAAAAEAVRPMRWELAGRRYAELLRRA